MKSSTELLPHGSRLEVTDGRPQRLVDRHGQVAWEATWSAQRLQRVVLQLPGHTQVTVVTRQGRHPLFGLCDAVLDVREAEPIACFQAVDWEAPGLIPPLDKPRALPPGAGAAILNLLSLQAWRSGREALRYRGPYATGMLFDALLSSFTVGEDLSAAFARFMAGTEQSAVLGVLREAPVDFVPAPHEWLWPAPGICVELRGGVERVFIEGRAFSRDRAGARRVHRRDERFEVSVDLAGARWALVAVLDGAGELLEGPLPLPKAQSDLLGAALPESLRAPLKTALLPRAPELLRPALGAVLERVPLIWGDCGADEARLEQGRLLLHCIMGERLREQAPAVVLETLALAIEPVAQGLAQQALARGADLEP